MKNCLGSECGGAKVGVTSEWKDLPNAALIDQVLADLRQYPELVVSPAVQSEAWSMARDAARSEAWSADREAAWDAGCREAWSANRYATRDLAWSADRDAAGRSAWSAIMALIAWDDGAAKWLEWDADRLATWAELSADPAAILLLPYVRIREQISQLEMT